MGWIDDQTAAIKRLYNGIAGSVKAAEASRESQLKSLVSMKALTDKTTLLNRGISTQVGFNEDLIDTYVELATKSLVFEARNKELNKTFGITSMGAAALSQTIQKLAITQGFSGEQAIGYANSIKKMLPSLQQQGKESDKTYKSMQRIQHVLTTNLSLTEDATEAYTLYASKNGKNADATMASAAALAGVLKDTDGTMGYMKQAISGIASAASETQLQFGKLPGNLELAVIKANALGFALDDLADTGKHLLNIESSIGQELEYQLLSGHRLVGNDQASEKLRGKSLTNAYREATLRGNMSDAASTLNTILEQEGTVLEDNLFAREKMAELMGIEEGQLSRALQKKKLLSSDDGLSVLMKLDGTALDKAASAMLDSGEMSLDVFNQLSTLNDTRTTDDIMKQQLTIAAESLVTLQSMLEDGQGDEVKLLREALTDKTGIKAFQDIMLNPKNDDAYIATGRNDTVGELIAKATEYSRNLVDMPSTDATSNLDAKKMVGGSDTVVPAGYGSRILTFPEDTLQPDIAFNDKDHIVASTREPTSNGAGMFSGQATDAGFMAVGRMIVAAINGSNLFSGTSMNPPTYS